MYRANTYLHQGRRAARAARFVNINHQQVQRAASSVHQALTWARQALQPARTVFQATTAPRHPSSVRAATPWVIAVPWATPRATAALRRLTRRPRAPKT